MLKYHAFSAFLIWTYPHLANEDAEITKIFLFDDTGLIRPISGYFSNKNR